LPVPFLSTVQGFIRRALEKQHGKNPGHKVAAPGGRAYECERPQVSHRPGRSSPTGACRSPNGVSALPAKGRAMLPLGSGRVSLADTRRATCSSLRASETPHADREQRRHGRRRHGGIVGRAAGAIGPVVRGGPGVAVDAHEPVRLVAVLPGGPGRVDRQQMVVGPQPVPVRVVVTEQPPLQHPVGGRPDPGHEVTRRKCRLFHVGEVIPGVPVEDHPAERLQREFVARILILCYSVLVPGWRGTPPSDAGARWRSGRGRVHSNLDGSPHQLAEGCLRHRSGVGGGTHRGRGGE